MVSQAFCPRDGQSFNVCARSLLHGFGIHPAQALDEPPVCETSRLGMQAQGLQNPLEDGAGSGEIRSGSYENEVSQKII
jgi:hypothetical protein